MKKIKIPNDLHFKNLDTEEETGEVVTFRHFVLSNTMHHSVWCANLEGARAAADLFAAMKQAADGCVVLPESIYDKLCQVIKDPSQWRMEIMTPQGAMRVSFGGGAMAQILPFVDAILKAEDA